MCKICGHKHWFSDGHVFGKGATDGKQGDADDKARGKGAAVAPAGRAPAAPVKARPAKKPAPVISGDGHPIIATAIKSPKGRTAVAHGSKPMSEKGKAALGAVIDAAVDAMEKRDPSATLAQAEAAAAHLAPKPKRGRGRPRTVEDRKAYKAEKERERRARQKAKP